MGTSAQDIARSLQVMASGFHDQGKQLNELHTSSPAAFQQVILSLLLEAKDTARFRFLIAYLAVRGLLPECLASLRSVDRSGAAVVAELAERMMPPGSRMPQTQMAKKEPAGSAVDLNFTLGLLESFTLGLNLLFVAVGAEEISGPKMRSRLAMILGKASRSHDAFLALASDADARVRANAVEALWGSQGILARQVFTTAASDPHHRVAANGLIGLYLQGEASSVAGLARMARATAELPLSAAAWAMGRTGDSRFLELLDNLRKTPGQSPNVHRNCLAALKRVRHSVDQHPRKELQVRIVEARRPVDGEAELVAVARLPVHAELPRFTGTQFQLRAGGRPIWNYTVEPEAAGPAAAVALLLPVGTEALRSKARAYRVLLNELLGRMRPPDRVSLNFYSEKPVPQQRSDYGVGALTHDAVRLQEELVELPGLSYLQPGPLGPLTEVAKQLQEFDGERHVVLVVDLLSPALSATLRVAMAEVKDCRVHVIYTAQAPKEVEPQLRPLVEASGGLSLRAAEGEELHAAGTDLLSALFMRYRLRGMNVDAGDELVVELFGDLHHGQASYREQS